MSRLIEGSLFGDQPVRTQRVFEEICGRIRAQIQAGRLRPGDRLPAERDLAVQFGTSRAAVREAMHNLELTGVVELRKGVKGGAFVRQGDPAMVKRSIADMVDLGRIPLENLTESRVVILDAMVRMACARGADGDFDALERSIAMTEELTQRRRWEERRLQLLEFYRILGRATGNEMMVILGDAITDVVLRVIAREEVGPREDTVKAHREIVKCLRQRDGAAAAELMTRHLQALHGHIFRAAVAHERDQPPARRTPAARASRADRAKPR